MQQDGLIARLCNRPGLRLGVMGGTFDPVHIAHLVTAQEALVHFDLDQVLFMPAGDAPHKSRHGAPPEFRYLLVATATASNPHFSVSRFEIDRNKVSYTVDTLEYLAGIVPQGTEMFFITGADAVLEILTWKDPARVLELSAFIAATRPGYDLSRLSELLEELRSKTVDLVPEARVRIMEVPALAISSSMIRERLAVGKTVRYLVPDPVAELIDKSGYYKTGGSQTAGRKRCRP
ncbi:MAG: nicotinate-nucleotide adenylyltransferase [Actinobacteria bacterium]|jgi:nicotinate-nucleotide adenylyltransferase|nr:nicotinate-nucleotide adenylyltransferase [Actinomycetota bacterium]